LVEYRFCFFRNEKEYSTGRVVLAKIAEDGGGVHVAVAEFLFDEGEIGADEGEV
jgi:hypothetical protein